MKPAARLEPINEYYFSRKLREIDQLNETGPRVINLGIGSPDLPPHPDVVRVLSEEAAKPNVHAYQNYKGSKTLRQAVAGWYHAWYGVSLDPEKNILPLIGSKEGIMHISMSFLNPGDEVLLPNPGYPTYRSATLLAGGLPVDYLLDEERGWLPDLEALEKRDLSKVKLMWVNYPHMPTGQRAPDGFFTDLVGFARRHGILVCHDNPYSFILNEKPQSLLRTEGAAGIVLELNSLSKSHNMAGWRVGTLCGDSKLIDEVLRFKSNMDSGMFLPVQLAAARALTLGQDWFDGLNEMYRNRRDKAFRLLDLLGARYDRDQVGLFVWASIPGTYADGYALSDEVLQHSRVFLTPGGIFGSAGDRYIRVSLCSSEEVFEEAIKRIRK